LVLPNYTEGLHHRGSHYCDLYTRKKAAELSQQLYDVRSRTSARMTIGVSRRKVGRVRLTSQWLKPLGIAAQQKESTMDEATSPEQLPGNLVGKMRGGLEIASEAIDQTTKAVWDTVKSKMTGLDSVEIYFREKPLRVLLVTFGIGIITGLLCRR
jgi:ElaB/YqjD/DUF883 family membrane-anchored ribosome-binding protein